MGGCLEAEHTDLDGDSERGWGQGQGAIDRAILPSLWVWGPGPAARGGSMRLSPWLRSAACSPVRDFSLVDAFRATHPTDPGFTWRNSRGAESRLDYIFMGGGLSGVKCVLLPSWASDHDMLRASLPMDGPEWGRGFWRLNTSLLGSDAFITSFTGFYASVRTLRPLFTSVVEWWEVAKNRFATFCRRYAVVARRRDRAEVARWVASLAYLHGRLNRGEPVDWAVYEGAKERLRGLLEARAKALAFQAQLRELEEGERPTSFRLQGRVGAPPSSRG
ncbi:hypothetical protein AAFF_G00101530 [Aldrovandia affinis]|uniref:Uncharacterized protein n=1 Tax=Aldrovandia affinis TaxID=143900 RepID=A0AAD7VXH4_9TELE|nr:hypothetical protein AAFF_G00101530 [Aldrovandia affinis]